MRYGDYDALLVVNKPDTIWAFFVGLYQLAKGSPYFWYTHCVLYFLDEHKVTRLELAWDGVSTQDLCWGYEYEEPHANLVIPIKLDLPNYVAAAKRLGLILSLNKVLGDKHCRFSIWSCVPQLLQKGYPFFNCASIISYILYGKIDETPSDLLRRVMKGYPFFNCSSVISYILYGTIDETPSDLMGRILNDS